MMLPIYQNLEKTSDETNAAAYEVLIMAIGALVLDFGSQATNRYPTIG